MSHVARFEEARHFDHPLDLHLAVLINQMVHWALRISIVITQEMDSRYYFT